MRALLLVIVLCQAAAQNPPKLIRVSPLGGQRGASVAVELLGTNLANLRGVEFDCQDLVWTRTASHNAGTVTGEVRIHPQAALGSHLMRVITTEGPSTSLIFNVGQFPDLAEKEPNDTVPAAQAVARLPVEIQGRLDGAADTDVFSFQAKAGERWQFEFRAIEFGSGAEARMFLQSSDGRRVAFNDDRTDYDENPTIEHRFSESGTYRLKIDQYRGPRGFNFGKLCAYTLRISALPRVDHVFPLGLKKGAGTRLRVAGQALDQTKSVYLTPARRGDYARMTLPYTMPIRFEADPETAAHSARIAGRVVTRKADQIEVEVEVPAGARSGLWRLWVEGPQGVAEGLMTEVLEASVRVFHGAVSTGPSSHVIQAKAGQPLHVWTLATQLGVPQLDTVIELQDRDGRKLAEADDVVAGQGSLVGNPDSSLYFTPTADGPLTVVVKDRLGRAGPGFVYLLKIDASRPGFQLVTTPENFAVGRGKSADLKVHLIREAGFEGEVEIWCEGLPAGIPAPRGRFRADQLFEPNSDGADMIIPEIAFRIEAPASLAAGAYPIRIFGKAAVDGRVVEAHNAMMLGPLLDLWNFNRRPSPGLSVAVYDPLPGSLSAQTGSLAVSRGGSATLELRAEGLAGDAPIRVTGLPRGVNYRVSGRQGSQVTLQFEGGPDAPVGVYEITGEVDSGDRKISTQVIVLSVTASESSGGR